MSAHRTVAATLLASILIVTAAAALLVLYQDASAGQQGQLTVTPDSGPVGTTVVLEGSGCNNPGAPVILSFGRQGFEAGAGTTGTVGLPQMPPEADGTFVASFLIPSELGTYQGQGGGPVTPGVYRFFSHPPLCTVDFAVTPAGLPGTGGGPPALDSVAPPLWIGGVVFAAALVLFGTAVAIRRTE